MPGDRNSGTQELPALYDPAEMDCASESTHTHDTCGKEAWYTFLKKSEKKKC